MKYYGLNLLQKQQNFGLYQIECDKINVAIVVASVSDGIKNMVGKGENTAYQDYLLFPTMFLKIFLYPHKTNVISGILTLCASIHLCTKD